MSGRKKSQADDEGTSVALAPATDGLGHANGVGDIVSQMAANPTLGQAIALQVMNSIQSDAMMTVGLIGFGDTQTRIGQLKTAWDGQIASLKANWSDDGAAILRTYIRGQRQVVMQLFMSMNRLALADSEARRQVEEDVDALLGGVLARISREDSDRPLAG